MDWVYGASETPTDFQLGPWLPRKASVRLVASIPQATESTKEILYSVGAPAQLCHGELLPPWPWMTTEPGERWGMQAKPCLVLESSLHVSTSRAPNLMASNLNQSTSQRLEETLRGCLQGEPNIGAWATKALFV